MPANVQKHLTTLDKPKQIHCQYTQIRHISSLNQELEFTGEIAIEVGKRMLWRTDKPMKSAYILTAESLRQWDEDAQRTITLPIALSNQLEAFYECFSALFIGDCDTLSKQFKIISSTTTNRLTLIPKEPKMKSVFNKLEIMTKKDVTSTKTMIFHETNGDLLTMHFHHVKYTDIPSGIWQLPPE